MGNYIDKTNIVEQLPEAYLIQLTDDEGHGIVNDARVDAAIADAEGEVDGYLGTRYATPLSPVPGVIKKFTVDIALYNLYNRSDTMPPERKDRYEAAIKFLLNVSRGLVSLGADEPRQSNSSGGVEISSSDRVFSRGKLNDL